MIQAKRDSKKGPFKKGPESPYSWGFDNSLLDVIVRSDTFRWHDPKKRGLLTTLLISFINYLRRKYYETYENIPKKIKTLL
jgi:hypothetical protein